MKKNLRSTWLPHGRKLLHLSVICGAFALPGFSQPQLLRDINHEEDVFANEYLSLTVSAGKVYFIGNHTELWKTTGNADGTVRIKSFMSIGNLTHMGSTLYFTADDGGGAALWKSTGTFGSTVKVKDFPRGSPSALTVVNGMLYFTAYTTTHGRELWKSDGTTQGTVLVRDIQAGTRGSDPSWLTNVNGTLYFSANDGKIGHELWKSDGTSTGTVLVKDVRPGAYHGSTPAHLTNVNGVLYFVAFDGVTGRELYKSDGTPERTVRLSDIRAGYGDPGIENLTAVNNTLFFTANDGTHGHELWKSDGTQSGTVLVKDMTPGRNGSHGTQPFTHRMGNFKSVFGLLYYTAYQNDTYYVWKSDGTEAGTIPLFVSSHAIGTPTPRFVPMGRYIYYFDMSEDEQSYYEFHLYRMNADGSNPQIITTLMIVDFYSTYEPELVVLNNSLYFWGRDDQSQGFKLFRSNGTPGSRVVIKDIYSTGVGSSPERFTAMGNKMFFIAEEETFSPSLWVTNGTSAGTIELQELDYAYDLEPTSSHLFFSTNYGLEIWKTDGTETGTVLVKRDPAISSATDLVNVNDIMYFETSDHGLWRTDGTEAGTIPLAEGNIYWMEAVDNILLFVIDRGNHVLELWRSNGMPAGTFRVRTFTGRRYSFYSPRAVSGHVMYFVADDGTTGNEIWRTDGTTGGTYLVADLHSNDDHLNGTLEYDIHSLEVWNDALYISAYDNMDSWALYRSNGNAGNATKIRALNAVVDMIPTAYRLHIFAHSYDDPYSDLTHWVTDGTAEGTEIAGDETFYGPIYFVVYDDILYFNGYEKQLWRSDGTSCGTFPVDVGAIWPGPMETLGSLLIFNGYSVAYGNEPYAFDLRTAPESPCGTPDLAAARQPSDQIADAISLDLYPNPFVDEISISVSGRESDAIDIKVYSHTGFPVEEHAGLKPNKRYRIGKVWKPGHYLLQINISGKVTSQQVLKE